MKSSKNNKVIDTMNNNDLDEMQKQIRNKTGHIMFLVTLILLGIDVLFYLLNIIPASYYAISTIVIILVCSYAYVNISIISGSYINEKTFKSTLISMIITTISITFAVVINLENPSMNDEGKIFLALVASGSVITIITLILKKLSEKKSE